MMIGQSQSLRALQAQLLRFASCDAPVLLEGETGTGKELAAREIHYASRRRRNAFVPVNCGALPDSLIESELFGYCRGAFTDAKSSHSGLIDHAKHGTLFLDEVDSLSPKAQVTLLRFLQDNEYRPVGSSAQRSADVRVIAATNLPLVRLAAEGRFRRDLLYRINPLRVSLPPLRERKGDVALLADYFLRDVSRRLDIPARRWTPEVLTVFETYAWPGNVRELENVVLRICLCAECPDIGLAELAIAEPALISDTEFVVPATRIDAQSRVRPASGVSDKSASSPPFDVLNPSRTPPCDAASRASNQRGRSSILPKNIADHAATSFSAAKTSAIASFERGYLIELMRRAGGNVSIAARLCNIERRQLGKLLKKRGIEKAQLLD